MIKEFEHFHGAVLRRIVVSAGKPTTVEACDAYGRVNSYVIANKLGLYIKHSTKRLPPWQFTFHTEHVDEIEQLRQRTEAVWIALVCGSDGIVLITPTELREMNECDYDNTWFVRVTRDRRTMYHLNGSADDLSSAKPRGVGSLIRQLTGAASV